MEQLINLSTSTADHEPGYYKMIILVTDTTSNNSTAIKRFKNAYGSYCGAYNNCNTANDIQNLLVDKANSTNTRIYVIQSYANESGSGLGTDGESTLAKVANVNTAWGTMTSGSGVTGKLAIKSYKFDGSVYSDKTYGN